MYAFLPILLVYNFMNTSRHLLIENRNVKTQLFVHIHNITHYIYVYNDELTILIV